MPVHTPSRSPDTLRRGPSSVFTKAVLDNEVVEVITPGELEQVFTSALPQRQIDLVGVE